MTELSREIKHSAQEWAPKFFTAAMIGLATSVPMALVMSGLDRLLPKPKSAWWSLPPKRITARFARRSGMNRMITPGAKWGAPTWLAHLGYGAATASLYPLFSRLLPFPSVLRGMVFAMTVWAGSYLGWLPAVKSCRPPAASRLAGMP